MKLASPLKQFSVNSDLAKNGNLYGYIVPHLNYASDYGPAQLEAPFLRGSCEAQRKFCCLLLIAMKKSRFDKI